MHYEVEVNGRLRKVVVQRKDRAFVVSVDGRQWTIDAARVDAQTLSLLIGGEPPPSGGLGQSSSHEVSLVPDSRTGALVVRVGDVPLAVSVNGRRRWGRTDESAPRGAGPERLTAPMPGRITRVLVKTGEAVSARQPVVVIEAMKMENELRASQDGTVAEIHVRDGQSVEAGELLAVIHR